jgi:PAS domain-containing protein
LALVVSACFVDSVTAQENETQTLSENQVDAFNSRIVGVLESYCADCHLDGADEGGVTLDALVDRDRTSSEKKLWDRALKQLRHDLMPPRDMDQPTAEEQLAVEQWIKEAVFEIDPDDPDPGHVIVRRLNRTEYRNTIKDLLDYEIDTEFLFPPDDTGHGFDNMAEVLTLSPMLMEKYIDAATEVVMARVPVVSRVPQQRWFVGEDYEILQPSKPRAQGTSKQEKEKSKEEAGEKNPLEPIDIKETMLRFFYSGGGKAKVNIKIDQAGRYDFLVMIRAGEDYVEGKVDANRCQVKIEVDDKAIADEEFARQGWDKHEYVVSKHWEKGDHWMTIDVTPLTDHPQTRRLRLEVAETRLTGPLDDPDSFVFPERHGVFFREPIPEDSEGRRQYAGKLIFEAAKRAFRRPPEPETVARLVDLAESVWSARGSEEATFERGIAQAFIAILSSPNFIFRETFPVNQTSSAGEKKSTRKALIDEYSLASRLSYFLWSTMPDQRMIELAEQGKLRSELDEVVRKMVDDDRFTSFYENFIGQWLRTRDIERVTIDAFAVLRSGEEGKKERALRAKIDRLRDIKDQLNVEQRAELRSSYRGLKKLYKEAKRFALSRDLRRSMRRETEMLFEHVVKTDSDLVQLIDSDFTFLNQRLANHYGIEGVEGEEMRRVELDPDDHRGGILTHGAFLAVSSNPDRTSPVKRGVFVLDNLLGMPSGSPPPNIPELEVSSAEDLTKFTLRKSLAMHREDPLCSSCHNRMDPLGLALENYDALGRYRTHESDIEIDASGELISGESFKNIDDLKQILATKHKEEFYRCVTEKMMTYALGRTVEYYDLQTIDDIVASLLNEGGKPSVLLKGIVESPAFQMTRLESLAGENPSE